MKRKNIFLVLLLILSMFLLSACGGSETEVVDDSENKVEESAEAESTAQNTLFGKFYSQTLDGENVTEEIFAQADLTMVNIWGTFCGPCIQEMPDLGELGREYEGTGFQIVGIITDVNKANDETAMQIVDETQADYTHIINSLDLQNNVLQYVSAVPTTVFIDREGNLVGDVYSGSRDKEAWGLIIEELLSEVQ